MLSTVKMRSKELSLSVKQAIISLKKQNKPIREIAKTLGVAKTTVWNILKKKEYTGELFVFSFVSFEIHCGGV